ncbi:hypothetical protein CC1G_11999 [Coprinopsis cinerea okayama7|uniref:Uncharacterized protein n=1 Tax=Coprinopsis cinerea (strain Okayama-7 / 130 / ATCC MYA-4618 / FGSC 9003) TaxID=240176 RepID=A8N0Z4_COPC7|nr:hypothetical protein CC1G_11999 [Coprinopsis cinerea okayama7\|eukprot:XP_001828551.2 hypothetical protein CC1G_11999 [Coprinopsis cinerea okayama7\
MSAKPSTDLLAAVSELHQFISTIPSWKNTPDEQKKKEELLNLTIKAYRKVKAEGFREEKHLGHSLINWINSWSRPYASTPHNIPLSIFSDNDFSKPPPLLKKYSTTTAKPKGSSSKRRKRSPSPPDESDDADEKDKVDRDQDEGEEEDDAEDDEDEDDSEDEDEDEDAQGRTQKGRNQSSKKAPPKDSIVVKKEKSVPPTKPQPTKVALNAKAQKQVLGHTRALMEVFKNERKDYLQENCDLKEHLHKLEGSFNEHRLEMKNMLASFKDHSLGLASKATPDHRPTTNSNPGMSNDNASTAAPDPPALNQSTTPAVPANLFEEWNYHCGQVQQGSYPPLPQSQVANNYITQLTPMEIKTLINYPDGDNASSSGPGQPQH